MNSYIEVKVVRAPGTVKTVSIPSGSTVSSAISAAELDRRDNEIVQVNGAQADSSRTLQDGDKVMLLTGAKGNIA